MAPPPSSPLRRIPKVDRLLAADAFRPLLAAHPRPAVVREIRAALEEARRAWTEGEAPAPDSLIPEKLAGRVEAALARRARPYYRRVINATGVVLHTNLGRAPLPPAALDALAAAAGGAQRLEFDLDTGGRGGRDEGCARLLREITGAEAAAVVNNNAAATLLLLAAHARGRRVLVSRGELVEIGGSYRVPEVMEQSGALLAEVGTTNRTHLRDYVRALDEAEATGSPVGMILKVHTSNYRIEGFTAEVPIDELAALGRERGIPVAHDLGSGSLFDLGSDLGFHLRSEPRVDHSVKAGADLVCFSGDKLLGGPQAGLLVGSAAAVERCRRHPLFRALRPGRLIYSALEAVLALYRDGEEAARERVPALARLTAPEAELRARAEELARRITEEIGAAPNAAPNAAPGLTARPRPSAAQAGSGSLPAESLPSWAVELTAEGRSPDDLAGALRAGEPPLVGRIQDGALLLDLRSVGPEEDAEILRALRNLS